MEIELALCPYLKNKNPHVTHDERDSPTNVFSAISKEEFHGLYDFAQNTVAAKPSLDIHNVWVVPPLEEDSDDLILQADVTTPHFRVNVRNTHPWRWIFPAGVNDVLYCRWPIRSPDVTTRDLLWNYIKYNVCLPLRPLSLPDLRQQRTSAMAFSTKDAVKSLGCGRLSCRHEPRDPQSSLYCSSWFLAGGEVSGADR